MKFQKVISLCKDSGELYITETGNVQWVTNGAAAYPLFGLPKFTAESLCETFGLSEEQQGKMILNEKSVAEFHGIDFTDLKGDEAPGEIIRMEFSFGGMQLLAVKSDGDVYFIKKKYLSPFDEEVELWKRTSKQGSYFVVAGGMLIKGIIVPERDARAQIAAEIKEIANMM